MDGLTHPCPRWRRPAVRDTWSMGVPTSSAWAPWSLRATDPGRPRPFRGDSLSQLGNSSMSRPRPRSSTAPGRLMTQIPKELERICPEGALQSGRRGPLQHRQGHGGAELRHGYPHTPAVSCRATARGGRRPTSSPPGSTLESTFHCTAATSRQSDSEASSQITIVPKRAAICSDGA